MLNHMGYNKANYQSSELAEVHNERGLLLDILSSKYMPKERLDAVRAAYNMPVVPPTMRSRLELADRLLAGTHVWSAELLSQHRARVGGTWREVRARARAAAEASASQSKVSRKRPALGAAQ